MELFDLLLYKGVAGDSGGGGGILPSEYQRAARTGTELFDLLLYKGVAGDSGGGDLLEWDFEWDYTMGKMSENGFSLSGNGSETTASNYCQLKADGNSISLVPPTNKMQDQKGVAEIVLNVNDSRNGYGTFNACLVIGDGTVSAYLACNANNWVLRDNNNSTNATVLAPLRKGVWQTIRIELNGATWALYIDGELISDSLDSSIVKANNGIMQVSKGTTRYQSVKYKFGRL